MLLTDFIQREVLEPKLKSSGVLVVYDPHQRYRQICNAMARGGQAVVDATDGSIEARGLAMANLQKLGTPDGGLDSLVV